MLDYRRLTPDLVRRADPDQLDRLHQLVLDDWLALKRGQWATDPTAWATQRLGVHLWSRQRDILASVVANRYTAVPSCHGPGKGLPLDTPIPTPTGWTTMTELEAGDMVLTEHGWPTRVLAVHAPRRLNCYRVMFDDGSALDCDADHLWTVLDFKARHRIIERFRKTGTMVDWRAHWGEAMTVPTPKLAELLAHNGQRSLMVPLAAPLAGQPVDLPMDPYVLGCWLGDGTSIRAEITTNDPELAVTVAARGYPVRWRKHGRAFAFGALGTGIPLLRSMGVQGAKHIPASYLRAPAAQRLELLAGLLDTDGGVEGQEVVITLTSRRLADGVAELATSLGWKVRRSIRRARLFQGGAVKDCGPAYVLRFRPSCQVFKLARKAERLRFDRKHMSRHTGRTIVSVEPVESVPTRCITVANPSGLFLAGRQMVPTHNSFLAGGVLLPWWISVHPPGDAFVVTSAPTGAQVKAILWREANRAHRKAGLDGRINLTEWYIGNELVAFGRKPADTDEEAFQGIHTGRVLIIFDEANGMPPELWRAARTLMTTADCRWLVIGNPNSEGTEFHRACESGRWNTIRIPAASTPNFTGESVPATLSRLLVTRQWVDEVAAEFGVTSDYYVSKVNAEFPAEDASNKAIPMRYIERCRHDRNFTPDQLVPRQLGVDVGAGGDKSVIQARAGMQWGPRWQTGTRDPETLGAKIVLAAREWDAELVTIDANGIGWAVVGIVRALARKAHRARVEPILTTEAPDDSRRFYNRRAELYWRVRERMREGDYDAGQLSDQAVHQLTELRTVQDPRGRIRVENKDEFTARLGRSPDDADAVVLAATTPRVRTRASAA